MFAADEREKKKRGRKEKKKRKKERKKREKGREEENFNYACRTFCVVIFGRIYLHKILRH